MFVTEGTFRNDVTHQGEGGGVCVCPQWGVKK